MAFTVTAGLTNGGDSLVLKVWVITSGTEAGGNVATGYLSFASPPAEFSFTPTYSGSLIVEALNNTEGASGQTWTLAANNALDDSGATANAAGAYWDGHYTGTVTAATPVTLGCSQTTGSNTFAYAAYEVKASGTPAIDASTPAAVLGSATAGTTASFTPPANAVLVAIITSDAGSAQVPSISDTSGMGLVWTQRGTTWSTAYQGTAVVYTTTIAPPVPTHGPVLASSPVNRPVIVAYRPGRQGAGHSR